MTTESRAEIEREYSFDGVQAINGVTWDGERVWFATDQALHAFDPESGKEVQRLETAADAGTAFDGTHLWQIAADEIRRIDPKSGKVVRSIPAPDAGKNVSGMTWAEGALWVGNYRERRILKVDPETGKVLKVLESDRFVTGVSWLDGELWHGVGGDGKAAEVRRIDAQDGKVIESVVMPKEVFVAGVELDRKGRIWCGGHDGKVRAVRKPRR